MGNSFTSWITISSSRKSILLYGVTDYIYFLYEIRVFTADIARFLTGNYPKFYSVVLVRCPLLVLRIERHSEREAGACKYRVERFWRKKEWFGVLADDHSLKCLASPFWLIRGNKLGPNIPSEILIGTDYGWMSSAATRFQNYKYMYEFALPWHDIDNTNYTHSQFQFPNEYEKSNLAHDIIKGIK
jgi:hypothetical protein